jgi:phenylacetate-CoA ligase
MTGPQTSLADLRGNVPGVRWPALCHGAFASLVALIRSLGDTQWMASAAIAARQAEQLAMLVGHASRQSNQFRGRLERAGLRAGDLLDENGLRRLPVLRRRDLQRSGVDLYCRDVPASHRPVGETRTSGSTGEPVVVKRTALNQMIWNALSIRYLLWQGIDFKARCSSIRPPISSYAIQNGWGPPLSELFDTGQQQSIPMTTDIKQQAAWLAEFATEVLTIYPTNLEALARYCRRQGIKITGLSRILSLGETLSPRVRQEAEATFGARISDLYSSQELGLIAAQCPDSGLYHVMAESVIVEVLDDVGQPCREGEVGRMVVTDLHNFATPLVRYDIGDYAEVAGACACGRGLPSLKRILGRERNMIARPDGTRHWPLVGFARFRDVAPVSQYQLIQRDLRRIEVRLVCEAPATRQQESELAGIICEALGFSFDLTFAYFEGELPCEPGGKFEEFRCELPAGSAEA